MPQLLPLVPDIANYRFGTALDGTQYVFDVRWNGRAEAWYLDVSTEAGELIRAGIKLVLGTLLGGRVADDRFPLGVFHAADMTGKGMEAGFHDLGQRVQVFFYAYSELVE